MGSVWPVWNDLTHSKIMNKLACADTREWPYDGAMTSRNMHGVITVNRPDVCGGLSRRLVSRGTIFGKKYLP